jgi:hypothetical protein
VANGKPGDHPVTDITLYGKTPFSPEINALIREIDGYTTDYGEYDPFDGLDDLLFAAESHPEQQPELHRELLVLRDRLRGG